jgi:hypothetical protein
MSLWTPGLQDRSRIPRDWGNYPDALSLPNASGAPLSAPKFALEEGDTAFVTGVGLFQCFATGAPGDGLAVWLQVGAGGGGAVGAARRDHSVNGALVDAFSSGSAILRTKTDGHVAGGYAGGGVGNKSILGHFLAAPLPLASLVSIEFTVLRITPEATFIPPLTNGYAVNVLPYANLVVELVPGSGVYSIFVFGDVNNTLLLGAYSVPGADQHRCVWTAASPGSGVLVVNFKGMATFVPGPTCNAILVGPAAQGVTPVIGVTTAAAWQAAAYSIAQILAVYPLAQIVNAFSGDGGLPLTPTITSGVMMMIGSSGAKAQNAVQLLDWKLNGVPI